MLARTSASPIHTHIIVVPVTAPDCLRDRGQPMVAAMLIRLTSLTAALLTTAVSFGFLVLAAQS